MRLLFLSTVLPAVAFASPPTVDGSLRGVGAATKRNVLAVWTDDEVYRSSNASAFERVLGGPGAVAAVAVAPAGDVAVVRGTCKLGLLHGKRTLWRRVPREVRCDGVFALAFQGSALALIASETDGSAAVMAYSADLGATWDTVRLEPHDDVYAGRVTFLPDGTVRAETAESCDSGIHGHVGAHTGSWSVEESEALLEQSPFAVDASGWSWRVEEGQLERLRARGWQRVPVRLR